MNNKVNSTTNPNTKYRIRDVLCNDWLWGKELLQATITVNKESHRSRPQDFVIQDYIGITTNLPIFEGDIVQGQCYSEVFDTVPVIGVVEYSNEDFNCGYVIKQITNTDLWASNFYDQTGMNISWDKVIVIGNIFDTPELLDTL